MNLRTLIAHAALASMILLTACAQPRHKAVSETTGAKLDKESVVYVAIPSDAYDRKEFVLNSGRQTATLLRDAFARHAARVHLGRRSESFNDALATARQFNCTYLAFPTVLLWEDRATEVSGRRDKIEVRLQIADVKSSNILHAATLKGTGAWMPSNGDRPIDILKDAVNQHVTALFQASRMPGP